MVSPETCCQSILADLYGARSASCAKAWRNRAGPMPISAAAAVPVLRNVRLVGPNGRICCPPLAVLSARLLPVKLGQWVKCYNKSNAHGVASKGQPAPAVCCWVCWEAPATAIEDAKIASRHAAQSVSARRIMLASWDLRYG